MNYLVSVSLKLRANSARSVGTLSPLGVDRQKGVLGKRAFLTLGKYLRHIFFKLMLHIRILSADYGKISLGKSPTQY